MIWQTKNVLSDSAKKYSWFVWFMTCTLKSNLEGQCVDVRSVLDIWNPNQAGFSAVSDANLKQTMHEFECALVN